MRKIVKMGKYGQVIIPPEMLKSLGCEPWGMLKISVGEDRITLKKFSGTLKERKIDPKKIIGRRFPVIRDMLNPRITAEQVREILDRHFKILARGSDRAGMRIFFIRPQLRKIGTSAKEYLLKKYYFVILSFYARIALYGLPEIQNIRERANRAKTLDESRKLSEKGDKLVEKIYNQRLEEIRKDWKQSMSEERMSERDDS